jgi:hypothetical protein
MIGLVVGCLNDTSGKQQSWGDGATVEMGHAIGFTRV